MAGELAAGTAVGCLRSSQSTSVCRDQSPTPRGPNPWPNPRPVLLRYRGCGLWIKGVSAQNPEFGGSAVARRRWKLANRRPLRHGELGCPWLSHLRFLSSLRRRALADKIEWPAAARPRLSAGSQSARAARRSSSPRRRQSARPTLSGNPHHALWRVEHLYFGSGGGYRRCGSACPNGRPIPHT